MLTRLQLGAEVDLATSDELNNGLRDLEDKLTRRTARPLYLPLSQQIIGTGNIGIIDHGGPPVGRIWEVKFWVPLAALPASTAPAMSLFIGPSAIIADGSVAESPPMQYMRLPNRTTFVFFGTDALYCHANENVVVATVNNLATGAVAGSFVQVTEWRSADKEMRTGAP